MNVILKTTLGDIEIALDKERAPKTVANFLQYVQEGVYTGTIFHRVIDGFMIQGGGFDKDMRQKATRAPIPNEADKAKSNLRGTIAMARTQDPDSATNQFFINVVDNLYLDYKGPQSPGYCVFGEVVSGTDVVDKIAKLKTGRKAGHDDVPMDPIEIDEITEV